MEIKFGYMPRFKDIFSEIKYAKGHYDFLELTFPPDESSNLDEYNERIEKVITVLDGFPVLGHLYWFDLTSQDPTKLNLAIQSIRTLKKVGANRVIVHPRSNPRRPDGEVFANNQVSFQQLSAVCKDEDVKLLVENNPKRPFSLASIVADFLNSDPSWGFTFDTGHANRVSGEELDNFLSLLGSKIEHIHLHDNVGQLDHLAFKDKRKIDEFMNILRTLNYSGTLTLEIFAYLDEHHQPQDFPVTERQAILLEQLNLVKANL